MNTETRAACAGTPDLWESTDPRDHAQARDVCNNYCEAREWCRAQLTDTLASVHGSGVRGTWAGQFFGKPRRGRIDGGCPKCGALDGQSCVSPAGKKITEPHRARVVGHPKCKACGVEFVSSRRNVAYCSDPCSAEGARIRHRRHDAKRPTVINGDRTRGAA